MGQTIFDQQPTAINPPVAPNPAPAPTEAPAASGSSVFGQGTPAPAAPPAPPASPAPKPTDSTPTGTIFDTAPKPAPEVGTTAGQPTGMSAMPEEKHGMVAKAWNWLNEGVISKDTFLRAATGMTTEQFHEAMKGSSDEGSADELLQKVKDAEKQYGVNDPKTQQLRRYAQAADDTGRYWQTFGRQFFSGALEDTAQLGSDFSSPMSLAMFALGPLAKGMSTAEKALPATAKLATTLRGAKTVTEISSLAASLGFGVQGATNVVKNLPESIKGNPDAVRDVFIGLSMMASAGHHTAETAKARAEVKATKARIEAEKNPRMTMQKIAGVDTPVLSTKPEPEMSPEEAAANMTAKEFHQKVTKPAAQKAVVNNLNQVMQDAIGRHEAIANGTPEAEKIAGTDNPSKFTTIDEAVDAAEATAKKTWAKGDEVDTREAQEHEAEKKRVIDEARAQHDEYNSRVVDQFNSSLSEGEEPMPRVDFDESKVSLPEKPVSLAQLRSELQAAKAKGASADPQARQEAYDKDIPKAQKALDGWFKGHADDIPQAEYDSLRRLNFQFERMQEISNSLRASLDNGNLTGNKLRSIEAAMVNKAMRKGTPDAANSFRNLLGDEGYQNWRKLAAVLDPISNVPDEVKGGTFKKFATSVLSHIMPGGFAAKMGAKFILDRAIADPEWNKWTTNNLGHYKMTGTLNPEAATDLNGLMQHTKLTEAEKQAGAQLPTPPPEAPKYGASNKGVSTEEYKKALDSFNKTIQGGMKTGVPLPLGDMLTIGRYHMEAGAHAFREWSGQMVSELGEAIRPQLQKVWDALGASDEAHAQFNAHKENGGSTFSPEGDNVGDANAFAVSAYPTRTKQYADGEFSPSHFDEFKKNNSDLLEQPGHAVGSWHDPDTGLHTLDVTRLIPDQAQAESVGRTANQKSIYHLGRGELVDTGGTGEAQVSHVVEDYNRRLGKPAVQDVKTPVNPELANQIADAYDQLKHEPNNPKVKKAYNALIKETKAQWKALQAAGYKLQPEDVDPYGLNSDTPAYDEMAQDVKNNKRIKVWTGGQPPADHPLSKIDPETGVSYNTLFRAVHDIMGHVAGENDFSQQGEENAYQRHAQSYSKNAVPALTTETRGQTSHFFNNEKVRGGATPDFVDQRAALLPSKFYAKEGSRWAGAIARMKEQYGTTSDPLKAGFILPEGEMIPLVGEHDKMLGGQPSDNLRESFIKETGAIRSRYRMSRAGEEQVFSLPKEITEEQARQIKAAAGKLRYGTVTLETVDGKSHKSMEFPTGAKVQEALDSMVKMKSAPEVEVLDEPSDVNASGESAASQEAVGRVASEKAQGVKRVKVLKNGQEVPLIGVDAVDARAGKGETIVKRYADGHEEIQDQGQGANYAGPKTESSKTEALASTVGSAERAKGDTEFFQQAKESMPNATLSQQMLEAERLRRAASQPSEHPDFATGAVKPSGEPLTHRIEDGETVASGKKEFTVWADDPNGTDAGSLTIRPRDRDTVRVDDAFLRKEYRGKGAGKEMYQKAMDEAKSRGFSTFESSHINGISPDAERVWKSLGAEVEDGRYKIDLNSNPDATASEIPTRFPRGKSRSSALNPDQHVGLEAMQMADEAAPSGTTADGRPKLGYMEKLARTIAAYTGVNYSKAELKNPQAVVSKFINHLSSNIEWLYNQVPEETRAKTRQWYDSANKVNKKFAQQFGVSPEQSAGVTAALSPQNPWDNNIGLAKEMMDTWANRQNVKMTPEMEKKAIDIVKVNPDFKGLMSKIRGKSLSEIKLPEADTNPDAAKAQAVLKGLWIRMFDEAHGSGVNDQYRPDGSVSGPSSMARSWIGLDHIAKAVRILEDGSLENINGVMGDGHKIRNFYNNIINPNSPKGHVTIDTHAVAAAQLQPFGTDSTEAAHNFGGGTKGIPGAPQSAPVGIKGTYPVYAEAYRRVAAKLGIHPRELQSVTWEAIKSLMGDEKKTPELKAKVKDIWAQVQKGKLTPDEARARIKEESGGFSKPYWMSEAEWEKMGSEAGDTAFDFGEENVTQTKTPFNSARDYPSEVERYTGSKEASSAPIRKVPVKDILSMQGSLDSEILDKYRAKSVDKNDLPEFLKKDGKYYILDGHHRASAEALNGNSVVTARVLDLDGGK